MAGNLPHHSQCGGSPSYNVHMPTCTTNTVTTKSKHFFARSTIYSSAKIDAPIFKNTAKTDAHAMRVLILEYASEVKICVMDRGTPISMSMIHKRKPRLTVCVHSCVYVCIHVHLCVRVLGYVLELNMCAVDIGTPMIMSMIHKRKPSFTVCMPIVGLLYACGSFTVCIPIVGLLYVCLWFSLYRPWTCLCE